jgi:hypothetical protein
MELDEKYLSRKLLEISQNTPLIVGNLKRYKAKCKGKNKGKAFVHEKALIKILKINNRIAKLLVEKELIRCSCIFDFNLFTVSEIETFLRSRKSNSI